jgi:hypothetical protein
MSTKRKSHSAKFKAKVALDAYKGDKTAAESVERLSPNSSHWRRILMASYFGSIHCRLSSIGLVNFFFKPGYYYEYKTKITQCKI